MSLDSQIEYCIKICLKTLLYLAETYFNIIENW